jgi:ADP-ribosylglycohydrolase
MLGAVSGDVIGSTYEFSNTTTKDFDLFPSRSRFTDDTVLTVAVADTLLSGEPYDFKNRIRNWARRYPNSGYGWRFRQWAFSDNSEPYGSYGNGSAMRVSPVGFAFDSEDQVLRVTEQSAAVTHNHPEGIKGAKAVALSIYLARHRLTKEAIAERIRTEFGYELSIPIAQIRKDYCFDETCQGSVPQAIRAFLESEDYESTIRLAVWLGGDSDTIACIAGGIAEAFYGQVPDRIKQKVLNLLPIDMKTVISGFYNQYMKSGTNT